jgi:hypothetical protein|tara:strand:+ start:19637 stop:21187 length:1551 start_codon:yes stop_codon:yes gene_type:complete
MKPNKKIDRLFQEKLKDLEVSPPDIVWENIEAHLDKKRGKRLIPLWWRMAGAAAILLSIATGGFYLLNTPSISIPVDNTITNTPIDSVQGFNEKVLPIIIPLPIENIIVDSKKTTNEQLNSNPTIIKKSPLSETITSSEIPYDLDNVINKTSTTENNTIKHELLTNNSNQTKTNSTKNTNAEKKEFQFAQSKNTFLHKDKNEIGITDPFNTNPIDLIQQNQKNIDWTLAPTTKKTEESKLTSLNTTIASINEESSSLETANTLKDSEDHLPEKTTESHKKWSVASIIAPVLYNSFNSKGSPMGAQFESNPKEGSNSIAYGVKVGYKINNKFSIQGGLSLMAVGFSVNEVYMNPTGLTNIAKLSNVNYNSSSRVLNVIASDEFSQIQTPETSVSTPLKGSLNQEYGYVEVPLELKYNLIDGRFRAHLITGFSTLILNSNEVYVENSEFSSDLGEANNLNNINFSGNFGFDFDYSLNENLYINVAPIFKIYTNTFSQDAGNFEPYTIGLYTGLNYRFD